MRTSVGPERQSLSIQHRVPHRQAPRPVSEIRHSLGDILQLPRENAVLIAALVDLNMRLLREIPSDVTGEDEGLPDGSRGPTRSFRDGIEQQAFQGGLADHPNQQSCQELPFVRVARTNRRPGRAVLLSFEPGPRSVATPVNSLSTSGSDNRSPMAGPSAMDFCSTAHPTPIFPAATSAKVQRR